MANRDELVTGQEAHKREEGSIFYATVGKLSKSRESLESYKKRADAPPLHDHSSTHQAEKLSSLERLSRASVTSTDVAQMILSEQNASAQEQLHIQVSQLSTSLALKLFNSA